MARVSGSWELTVHPLRHIWIWQQPYVSVYVGQWPSWAWQLRKDYRLLLTGMWTVSKGHQESQFLQPVKYCSNSTRVITEVSFCSSLLKLKGISDKKRWDCYYCLSSISWKIYEIKRESKSQINKKKHRKKQNDHVHKVLNKYIIEIVKKKHSVNMWLHISVQYRSTKSKWWCPNYSKVTTVHEVFWVGIWTQMFWTSQRWRDVTRASKKEKLQKNLDA